MPDDQSTVLDSGAFYGGLIVDADEIYWISEHRLRRVPKNGDPVASIGPELLENALAADAAAVFVVAYSNETGFSIVRVPKDGAATATLATAPGGARALTADADSLFFVDDLGAYRLPKSGGASTTVTTFARAGLLAELGADLYLARRAEPALGIDGGIFKVPKSGGTPANVVPSDDVSFIVAADDALYWAEYVTGEIHRLETNGSDQLLTSSSHVRELGADATHLYWTSDSGDVSRIPLEGGAIEGVATANALQKRVYSLGVSADAERVYFAAMVPGEYSSWVLAAPKVPEMKTVCSIPL